MLSGIGAALVLGGTLLAVFLLDQSARTLTPRLADDAPAAEGVAAPRTAPPVAGPHLRAP